MGTKSKLERRVRRAHRTRSRFRGTAERPRLSVFRSAKHFSAQIIDDVSGKTLAAIHDSAVTGEMKPVELARELGKMIAQKGTAAGVSKVIFDRGPYAYHGRVAAFADGAREGGLIF